MTEAAVPQLAPAKRDAQVARVEAIPIVLPGRADWRWRGLNQQLGAWVLVRVESDPHVVGWGEATPLPDWGGDFGRYYGETPSTVVHLVEEYLAPAIVGIGVWETEALRQRVDGVVRGHPYAKAALEMAIWDIRGRLADQPLYRLLGGSARSVVPIAHMLGLMPPRAAVEEAAAAMAEGIQAFQIKVPGHPLEDAETVAAIRAAVGPDIALRVDVNQGYARLPLKRAIDAVKRLADAGADLVEQPVEGLSAMAAVREAVEVLVIADESCWGSQDFVDLVQAGAADAISIYVAKAGGLAKARQVAELADALGLPCDVNGSLESAIGTAASLHLALACPAISLPAVIPCPGPATQSARAGRYYLDDVVTEALPYENGGLLPPAGAGLGIEVDEEKIDRLRVRR